LRSRAITGTAGDGAIRAFVTPETTFERSRWFHLSCVMRFESRHSRTPNLASFAPRSRARAEHYALCNAGGRQR
jgi:hypothetical protein